jgi:hypothetical protein
MREEWNMTQNEGKIDRIARVAAGIAIMGYGVYSSNALGFIGIVPFATGLIGYCPLYSVFGFSTCPLKRG